MVEYNTFSLQKVFQEVQLCFTKANAIPYIKNQKKYINVIQTALKLQWIKMLSNYEYDHS